MRLEGEGSDGSNGLYGWVRRSLYTALHRATPYRADALIAF